MKLFSSVAFVSAFTMAVLSAGAASADCKQTCNTKYVECGQGGRDQIQCLTGWRTCKMQCSGGATVGKITPTAAAAQPKGGVIQKAAVKH